MQVSGSAMWLLTLVLAFTAGISACEGPYECTNNTTQLSNSTETAMYIECLDRMTTLIGDFPTCECRSVIRNATGTILEVECIAGVPLIDTLPRDIQRLVIQSADDYQVMSMLNELENSSLSRLSELIITNCSLVESNFTCPWVSQLVTLNVSGNNFAELSDVRIINGSDIKVLDLSMNQLSELSAIAFRTLTGLVRLSLRGNIIETVDEDTFVGLGVLEDLDMADNKLTVLPDDTLTHLSSLQTLNLSGNQLRILGARWFEALGRLRELDISRNGLTKAASGVLQPLPGLSVLRLAENPLMERDVSLLLGTGRRLETVDASRTGLVRVPAALTRSVRALRLAGNKLTCIRDGDFDGYPLLKILDLSDNLLNEVEEDALGRLETLEKLDLSGNELKIVPRSLPGSLTLLNLRGNLIETLTFNDLQGIDNLCSLILSDNSIIKIEEGALSQLPLLTKLDISNNPIKQLPANTLAGPTSLTDLRMSGLSSLEWENERRGDMAFPVPTPDMLVSLDVSHSPALAAQLLADNAALSACKSLLSLNLMNTNITSIRFDLIYLLPQLRTLGLSENEWNCTFDFLWLGDWIRQHEEIEPHARCNSICDFPDVLLVELPAPPITTTVSTTTITTTSSESSYHFRMMGYPQLSVPNTSSNASNINATKSKSENTAMLDEIPNVETQRVNTNGSVELDDDRYNGNSKTSQFRMKALSDIRKIIKPRKKTQSIVVNEMSHNEDKGVTMRVTTESTRTNERGKLVREEEGRQRLREILDNRVDSMERQDDSFRNKDETYATTNSGTLDNVEFRTSNKITWDPTAHNTEKTKNVKLVNGKMEKITHNFVLANDIANTVAEELNGHAATIDARSISNVVSHPGMLILIGAIIGAAAALTVVLSRRATIRRRDRYHRHENIEVHTLTPTAELW
ncbi:hypothetical protein PV325_004745 [Microctonus aethiopoides]|nr:hypothetical protein PV325_004745 [Microctonus aethiopoides]